MITHEVGETIRQTEVLKQRRIFMALSMEERRKRLWAQAELMSAHYEQKSEEAERLDWQGGEIVEP